jgi:hypothetical protein
MIKLIAETHTYVNDKFPNMNYTSVTTVLGKYKDKFNEDYHAERVAARKGVTKQEIIAEWREINRLANEYGTNLHEILERFLLAPGRLYSPRDEFEKVVINAFKKVCEEEKLSLINSAQLKPEHIMSIEFTDKLGIAGTSDIIEDIGYDKFNVWDFKTNKKFEFENAYGEYLHFPVNHLAHCQYNDYTLQLSIYGVMYERETGRKFNRAGLFYWDKFAQTFKLIPVVYMKREAELLIDHYKITIGA